jgi:hypothetical protein
VTPSVQTLSEGRRIRRFVNIEPVFAHANQFFRRDLRRRLVLDCMSTPCALALPFFGEGRHAPVRMPAAFDTRVHIV